MFGSRIANLASISGLEEAGASIEDYHAVSIVEADLVREGLYRSVPQPCCELVKRRVEGQEEERGRKTLFN